MKQYCHSFPACKYFISWYDFMGDDDPMEPQNEGKCQKEENCEISGDWIEEMIVSDDTEICEYYEPQED